MHIDERVELKNNFITYLSEKGWDSYTKKEEKTINVINILFKIIQFVCIAMILGLAFSSMRQYIPRVYGWISLAAAVLWLFIERMDFSKIDRFFLRKKQKSIFKELKANEFFLKQIELFAKLDMIDEKLIIKFQYLIDENKYIEVINEIKKILFTLNSVKTVEQIQREYKGKLVNPVKSIKEREEIIEQ